MNASEFLRRSVGALDRIAKFTGLLDLIRYRCAYGVTILMYHKVLPSRLIADYPLRNLVIDAALFNRQMTWLSENFEIRTIRDAMAILDGGMQKRALGSRPLACVTFDDGYRDNFCFAAPVLESLGLRATFFITTGFVEGRALWFDRAALAWQRNPAASVQRAGQATRECRDAIIGAATLDSWLGTLKRLSPKSRSAVMDAIDTANVEPDEVFGAMTLPQLRDLADRGHEIASHSVSHPILTFLDDGALCYELEHSRMSVRDWTGQDGESFCYPNGDYDDRVIMAACAAGYRYGCSVRRGMARPSDDRMTLPRRAILTPKRHEMATEGFESEVVGWHDLLRRSRKYFSPGREYPW